MVGVAARVPGAATAEEFWANLRAGRSSLQPFTDEELLDAGEDPALLADPAYVRAGAPLAGIELFDADFFGFSSKDAAILDPQHRQFLETCWEALEDAGHVPTSFPGSIGVFAGSGQHAYFTYHLAPNRRLMADVGAFLVRHTGNDKDFLTTRVSYCLDLKGPSVAVQSACSTSLVAIHLAVQSLLARECDLALAGGVTIELPARRGYLSRAGEILSPDGHCRAFDASAAGTVFGSGVGVVVLRRAADALADGDAIRALVRGSAVNNDGRSKVGYLAPSVDGQASCVAEALAIADVLPTSISYVEAHGTGTPVGDPIETAALTAAFGRRGSPWCGIGSVKSNIGHLDTAAGVASFIKVVLALEHRQIPASLDVTRPNAACGFEGSPFYVNDTLREWQSSGPRRAGVNSLGVGGTNAHVILEEAPPLPAHPDDGTPRIVCVSARSPAALERAATRLAAHLRRHPDLRLADVAHTLHVGRRAFGHRLALVAGDLADAAAQLESRDSDRVAVGEATDSPPVVLMFPGGGSQHPNMGRGLYAREPGFRADVDRLLETIEATQGLRLASLLFPEPGGERGAEDALAQATPGLLATFVVEYALARLWQARGVVPAALIGHSLGEVVAACFAGVMSPEDAIVVIAARGRILDALPVGATLAVALPELSLRPLLGPDVSIAAVNLPTQCVVSGPREAIADLERRLDAIDVDCQRVRLAFAAHSALLDPHLDGFAAAIAGVRFSAPTLPLISNETGRWATAEAITRPDYWVRHLRRTVRFAEGLAQVLADHRRCVLLEAGPGRTLTTLVARLPVAVPAVAVPSMRHPHDATGDEACLAVAMSRLWTAGVVMDWDRQQRDGPHRRVPLPTYPFEHQRHWIDAPRPERFAPPDDGRGDEIRSDGHALYQVPEWRLAEPPPPAPDPIAWLVFDADDADRPRIDVQLRDRGRVVRVVRGDAYAVRDDGTIAIRPGARDDYDRLLVELASRDLLPTRVAHLWGLHADGAADARLDAAVEESFFSLVWLVQAWDEHCGSRPVHIAVVSSGAQSVGDERATAPERAIALGPTLVVPREYAAMSCASIDWVARHTGDVDGLVLELCARDPAPVVAWRGRRRWVPGQRRHRPAEAESPSGLLKRHGVYLITGGFGALGLAVADHLARRVEARLVLIGRHGLPARSAWPGLLASGAADADTIRQVAALEQRGEVLALAADVSSAADMDGVLEAVLARFGRIDGVFHAAGVIDDRPVATTTRESAAAVLRPKLHGLKALETVVARTLPDFLVLFSSVSALIGPPGQVDYAAANAYLDAYAYSRRDSGPTRVVAIDWAPWRDRGMAAAMLATSRGVPVGHPLLGRRRDLGRGSVVYDASYEARSTWLLDEHRAGGRAILPATAYVEILSAVAAIEAPGQTSTLHELLLLAPLATSDGEAREVRIALTALEAAATWRVTISSRCERGDWIENARARLSAATPTMPPRRLALDVIAAACGERQVTCGPTWRSPQERHLALGPRWRCLERVRAGRDQALVELELPTSLASDLQTFALHPALLDQAVGGGLMLADTPDDGTFFVPVACDRIEVWRPLSASVRVHVRRVAAGDGSIALDLVVADQTGEVCAAIERLTLAALPSSAALADPDRSPPPPEPPPDPSPVLERLLACGIESAAALAALDALLNASPPPQVVVSPVPLERLVQIFPSPRRQPRGPSGRGPRVAPRTASERLLAALWADALGLDEVGVDDNWFALGGHSLLGIRVLSRVRKACDVTLPPGVFFASPTITAQALLVERAMATRSSPVDRLVPIDRERYRRTRAESRP
ncbi:MAG: SDR family oxidoreductase [Vicinamibacterales bacterium]